MKIILTRFLFTVALLLSATVLASDTIRVSIDGMTCPACAEKVENELSVLPWIDSIKINLAANYADFAIKEGNKSNEGEILDAVKKAGFQVIMIRSLQL